MPGKMGSLKPPRCSTRSRSKKVLEVLAERNQMVVPVGAWVEPAQPDALEIPAHVSSCLASGIWGASPCCTLASALLFCLLIYVLKCKREYTCICMQFELASWHSVYFICILSLLYFDQTSSLVIIFFFNFSLPYVLEVGVGRTSKWCSRMPPCTSQFGVSARAEGIVLFRPLWYQGLLRAAHRCSQLTGKRFGILGDHALLQTGDPLLRGVTMHHMCVVVEWGRIGTFLVCLNPWTVSLIPT